jgi:hypothetical protein
MNRRTRADAIAMPGWRKDEGSQAGCENEKKQNGRKMQIKCNFEE